MRNLDPRRRRQKPKQGSKGPTALRQAWVHLLSPADWQVQMPQVDLANGILKHLLLFVLGPENCWCFVFPHCLFGLLYSSMSQQDKSDCELLLSRSLAASDGLPQVTTNVMLLCQEESKLLYWMFSWIETHMCFISKSPCCNTSTPRVHDPFTFLPLMRWTRVFSVL